MIKFIHIFLGGIILSDFKVSPVMYGIACAMIAFIVAQSLFFIVKSWKHGKKIGIKKETLVSTVTSSILFSLAPAISILATVIVLANALGIVLPWIRLTVVGNLAYETVAAETALGNLGGSLSKEITDPSQFSTVAWAMTLGSIFPLTFLPLVCKKLQKKIGGAVSKNEKTAQLGDILSAAAFIGIISAFIARAIAGTSKTDPSTNAGVMSVCVLVVSIVAMLVLTAVSRKFKWTAFEPFTTPVSMFIGMGSAILMNIYLPDISAIVWR